MGLFAPILAKVRRDESRKKSKAERDRDILDSITGIDRVILEASADDGAVWLLTFDLADGYRGEFSLTGEKDNPCLNFRFPYGSVKID